MSSTTNPNAVASNPTQSNNLPTTSEKQPIPPTTTSDKASTTAPKLNQTEDSKIDKKEKKPEVSTEPKTEKSVENANGKTEVKDEKVQKDNKEKDENKNSVVKNVTVKAEDKKEKPVREEKIESQTVIYDREPSSELIKLTSIKAEKKEVLEHKTSLEAGNRNKEQEKAGESKSKEKKEEKEEKVKTKPSISNKEEKAKTKSSLGKKLEDDDVEEKGEKSDREGKEAISSVDIEKNDEVRLTESDSKVIETKGNNAESTTRKGDGTEGKEKDDVAFKKKVEKIVEEKMQKEVDKLVEKKMEKMIKIEKLPQPQPQPQVQPQTQTQEPMMTTNKFDKLGYVTNPKDSVSDRYLFSSPNQSDYGGANSTLGRHTRFWEIEKRMQDLKEKHNRSVIEQASIKEQRPEKSYIYSIRDRLTSLPPLMSNLNNYEGEQTPKEDLSVYYTEQPQPQPEQRVGRGARAKSIEEPRGQNKPLESNNKAKSKLLPQLLPQSQQNNNKRKEQPNTMPKLYETYLGKDFVKKVVNKLEGGSSKARSSSTKPVARSAKKSGPVEQQVFRLVTKETEDGKGYQIVGYNSKETNNVTNTEEREGGGFFVDEQKNVKKVDRGHLYGSAPANMGNNSGRRNSARNMQIKGEFNGNKGGGYNQYPNNFAGNKVGNQAGYPTKGSNLLRQNVKADQYHSVGGGPFNGTPQKNGVVMGTRKQKRSSSVIAEVNESNLLSSAMTFHGSQETLKKPNAPKRAGMQRIDSGSLIRQVYRVRGMSRQGSSSDIEDANNMTFDVADANKSNIVQPTRERRRSNDFSLLTGRKGFGFTTAQRTKVLDHYESPGPKYDLSSYKSLVGGNKLRVEDYIMSKRSAKSPDSKTGNRSMNESPEKDTSQLSMRSNKGPVFGTARRDITFKNKADIPGPGDYNIPQIKGANGAAFGKERRSLRGVFPKTSNPQQGKV